jgi:hypothetical protein
MEIPSRRLPEIKNLCTRPLFVASLLAPLLVIALVLAAGSGRSQSSGHTVFAPPRIDQPTGFGVPTVVSNNAPVDPVAAERRRAAVNAKRQKQMVADSEKLLKLARELNDEVEADGSGPFTSEQLEKLNRIEKLARNVKEKMLDSADQPAPSVSGPPIMFPNH